MCLYLFVDLFGLKGKLNNGVEDFRCGFLIAIEPAPKDFVIPELPLKVRFIAAFDVDEFSDDDLDGHLADTEDVDDKCDFHFRILVGFRWKDSRICSCDPA